MPKRYKSNEQAGRVRTEACRLAAEVMAGRPNENTVPMLWCLAVFFESYIGHGSKRTLRNFGPRKPVDLKVVGKAPAS